MEGEREEGTGTGGGEPVSPPDPDSDSMWSRENLEEMTSVIREEESESQCDEPIEDETTSARSKQMSEALQREDEFLEYLMSLPAVAEVSQASAAASITKTLPPLASTPHQPIFLRSTSQFGDSSTGGKVGLDHLDNLCKLMEQLGDLREQNSRLQRRVQYLEELKNLHEMHKQLQQPAAAAEASAQPRTKHRHSSATEDTPSPPRDRDDSPSKTKSKTKFAGNSRIRQTLLLRPQRERSRSVGIEELKADAKVAAQRESAATRRAPEPKQQRFPSQQPKNQKRRSVAGAAAPKGKVSKWTKVKEAFRWEKAAAAPAEPHVHVHVEDTRSLRVPTGADSSDASPARSADRSPLPGDFPPLPSAPALSSSSSSEDLDIELNFADILAEIGPQRSASATDSTGNRLAAAAAATALARAADEDDAGRRSKSLDGDASVAGLRRRHSTKGSSTEPAETDSGGGGGGGGSGGGEWGGEGKLKSHKTPWGKVKDIIQTRKDSLKKRQRRGDGGSDREDEVNTPPPALDAYDSDAPPAEAVAVRRVIGDPQGSSRDSSPAPRPPASSSSLSPADPRQPRRLTPTLTLTLPSSEDMRLLAGAGSAPTASPGSSTASPPPQQAPGVLGAPFAPSPGSSKPPPSPQSEERMLRTAVLPHLASGASDEAICSRLESRGYLINQKQLVPCVCPSLLFHALKNVLVSFAVQYSNFSHIFSGSHLRYFYCLCFFVFFCNFYFGNAQKRRINFLTIYESCVLNIDVILTVIGSKAIVYFIEVFEHMRF